MAPLGACVPIADERLEREPDDSLLDGDQEVVVLDGRGVLRWELDGVIPAALAVQHSKRPGWKSLGRRRRFARQARSESAPPDSE